MSTVKSSSDERYQGVVGTSRRTHGHVACPCGVLHPFEAIAAIDVSADPSLARRVMADEPLSTVECPTRGELRPIVRPVVVHDPERALFALVLPEAYRAREIEERMALYAALAQDPAPIPAYVVDFAVVYGGDALAALIAAKHRARPTLVRDEPTEPATAERARLVERGDETSDLARLDAVAPIDPAAIHRGLLALQHRRRALLQRALEVGLWPGAELADVAVADGMVASRRELVIQLRRRFTAVVAGKEHALEDALVADNWQALRAEAVALELSGEDLAVPRGDTIASGVDPTASGTIGPAAKRRASTASIRVEVDGLAVEALIALLDDATNRLPAAVELARRAEPRALGPVFGVLEAMSRAEAGRLLGAIVGFGAPAVPPLIGLLAASKGYLRQGAALALAVLRDDGGVEAVCDLLLAEPTEIWREIARALGEAGNVAVMPMAARLATAGSDGHERVAWALAHVAARGALGPVEALARGRDPIGADVGRRALELVDVAQRDQLVVMSDEREQTVNRAFSRRFFEAMAAPGVEVAAAAGAEMAHPHVALEEADLLHAAELVAELDEVDLLPT
jgi:hypothetical protein